MKMTAADIKKYPKFAHYVRHDVPDLIYVPSVMHNLKTKGHLTDAESRHALRWGHEPLIVITDLSRSGSRGGLMAVCSFRNGPDLTPFG